MAHQVTLEEIAAYNHMRQDLKDKILTLSEVRNHLRNTILPKSDSFVSYLTQGANPALIRVNRGEYKFPEKPVHISVLQRAFDKKSKVQSKSNKKWRAKNTTKKDVVTVNTVDEIIERVDKVFDLNKKIEEAAKLLKQHGWLLKRPVTTYEDY